MMKVIKFNITVGYDTRSLEISEEDWESIQKGEEFCDSVEDCYEGGVFIYTFNFNSSAKGSLHVSYQNAEDEDGSSYGEGYIGNIQDGWVNEEVSEGVDEDNYFIDEPTDEEKLHNQAVQDYLKRNNLKIIEEKSKDSDAKESL